MQEHGDGWPDQAELERWEQAARDSARRIRAERGVQETVAVSAGYGALWVTFGERRVQVTGDAADVRNEQELFEDLDFWVAFDRDAGPGRVLDRDRAVIVEVRDRMPLAAALWTAGVERVLDDLRATTSLRWTCALVVHEDEPAWPRLPPSGEGFASSVEVLEGQFGPGSWDHLPRRQLPLPQLRLECDAGWVTSVDEGEDDPEVICAGAADRVAGEAIDELWHAWPPCPWHGHPLAAVVSGGRACWACPADGSVISPVGALGSASPDR